MQQFARLVTVSLIAAISVVSVIVGIIWFVTRGPTEDPAVFVGEPPSTQGKEANNSLSLHELWRVGAVGMSGSFAPSGGQLILRSEDLVFVAEGFGPGIVEPAGRITALDRESGDERWTAHLGGPAFLQGAANGTLIANTQYDRIVGIDILDGAVRWQVSLSALGYDNYGAVASAVTDSRSAIGASSVRGDPGPPVVLGVDTRSGEVLWRTTLAEGTDLDWGSPPVDDGQTVFTASPSGLDGAPEDVAHLIDLASGSILWTVGPGGGLGFSIDGAILDGPYVHIPAESNLVTVDRADGSTRWTRPGRRAFAAESGLWLATAEHTVELLDPATGETIQWFDVPIEDPVLILGMEDDRLAVVGHAGLAVLARDGSVQLETAFPAPLVDVARFDGTPLLVMTADRSVAAYSLESS